MIQVTKEQAAEVFWLSYSKYVDPDWFLEIQNAFENKQEIPVNVAANKLKEMICSIIGEQKPPVSVLLSGGVDSTFMLLMTRECFEEKDIRACTIGFREKEFDETNDAADLAWQLDMGHRVRKIKVDSVLKFLARLDGNYNEWFFSSSSVPTYEAIRLGAAAGNTVVTGDGGDELFCGYDRTILADKANKFPSMMKKILNRCIQSGWLKTERQRKLRKLLESGYEGTVCIWSREQVEELMGVYPVAQFDHMRDYIDSRKDLNQIEKFMLLDIGTELYGVEVEKVNTAVRQNNCRVVCPFLDEEIMKFCCSLPMEFKYSKGIRKRLLRKMIKDQLPEYRLKHKKKGFGVPVGKWFTDTELRNVVKKHLVEQRDPWLNQEVVRRTWSEHLSGAMDHTQKMWSLFMWRILLDRGIMELVE